MDLNIEETNKRLTDLYKELLISSDFAKELETAGGADKCLLCSGKRLVAQYGVCIECLPFIDRDITDQVEKDYKVKIVVQVAVTKN